MKMIRELEHPYCEDRENLAVQSGEVFGDLKAAFQ